MSDPVAHSGITEEKRQLRMLIRRELEKISVSEQQAASHAVRARIVESDQFCRSRMVAFYWATGWEIDLSNLLSEGEARGRGFALPRWCAEREHYEFVRVRSTDDLGSGRFGIKEPRSMCGPIERRDIDLVLVPGLAFSRRGGRLGRGRGFYDRLLGGLEAEFLGVCHEIQVKDTLPTHPWDQVMNHVVTPRQWIVTRVD